MGRELRRSQAGRRQQRFLRKREGGVSLTRRRRGCGAARSREAHGGGRRLAWGEVLSLPLERGRRTLFSRSALEAARFGLDFPSAARAGGRVGELWLGSSQLGRQRCGRIKAPQRSSGAGVRVTNDIPCRKGDDDEGKPSLPSATWRQRVRWGEAICSSHRFRRGRAAVLLLASVEAVCCGVLGRRFVSYYADPERSRDLTLWAEATDGWLLGPGTRYDRRGRECSDP